MEAAHAPQGRLEMFGLRETSACPASELDLVPQRVSIDFQALSATNVASVPISH
jgi:hypothetical protein